MYNTFNPNFNPNFNQTYNPYNQFTQYTRQDSALLKVNGIDGARAYQMQPNSTVALFDANDDIFYVKTSDSGGFSSIRTFQFVPVEEKKQTPTDYVTRAEFNQLKEEIANAKQFIRTENKQPIADADGV